MGSYHAKIQSDELNPDQLTTPIDLIVAPQEMVTVVDPVVDAALQGQLQDRDLRTIQRRFLRATGLTQSAVRQIERARYATRLLLQGRAFRS